MRRAIVLVAFLGCGGVAAAQQPATPPPSPIFKPRLDLNTTAAPAFYRTPPAPQHAQPSRPRRHDTARADTEVICGLTVIRKSPDADRGILVPPKEAHRSVIRRIQPPVCTSQR